MNAVIVSVVLMLLLSLARMHVMLAMIIAAIVAGLIGGLDLQQTLDAFNLGIGSGAGIALSYALLGGFAVAISLSGLPQHLRSEEHTSELQSRPHLVCRLLLEKKNRT